MVYVSFLPHNASDLVEAKEVGVRRVCQLPGMGHVNVHPVVLLQLNGGAQVALCGPRVTWPQGAQTLSVALHQDLRQSLTVPPNKHSVCERGTVLDDELHPRVNVVAPVLINLQSAILSMVRNATCGVRWQQVWIPVQCLREFLVREKSCRQRENQSSEFLQRVGGSCTQPTVFPFP